LRVAALDLGSNTFILTIAERHGNGDKVICLDEIRYVRLGQGVDQTKSFHPEALSRAHQTLKEFSHFISEFKPTRILATATSAARDVKNGNLLIEICQKFNIPVEIISGLKEAELTFLGARFYQKLRENHWVIDIGGGSTEVIYGGPQGIMWRHSFDLGCVRLAERWSNDIDKIKLEIEQAFESQIPSNLISSATDCIGVAGTPVEVVRLLDPANFSIEACEGFILSKRQLEIALKIVSENRPADLTFHYQTPEGRADVLYVGVHLLNIFMKIVKLDRFIVSRTGIRFGVIEKLWE